MILLHPLGGSSELWLPAAELLHPSYRIIAPDFLGCGDSDKPDVAYPLSDFVETVLALLDHLKLGIATLIGNSLGGHVAILTASAAPTRVSSLVLANSSGMGATSMTWFSDGVLVSARLFGPLSLDPSERIMRVILSQIHGVPGKRAGALAEFYNKQVQGKDSSLWKQAFLRTLQSVLASPIEKLLEEIDQPTLVIWGARDRLLGKSAGKRMAARIRGSQLEWMPKVGHFPEVEDPKGFVELAMKFLSQPRLLA